MSSLTPHYGFRRLTQGDSLSMNGYQFTDSDRLLLDKLLNLALEEHKHTGSSIGSDAPTDGLDLNYEDSGGFMPPSVEVKYVYTLVDDNGLESPPSPEVSFTTPAAMTPPDAPSTSVEDGGLLQTGVWLYVLTAWRGPNTNETLAQNYASANVPSPGNGKVTLELPELPSTAEGFNVYRRSPNSGRYLFLKSINMDVATPPTVFVDDGTLAEDCVRGLPTVGSFSSVGKMTVTLPGATPNIPVGWKWRLYRTYTSSWGRSFVAEGTSVDVSIVDLGGTADWGSPPSGTVITFPSKINLENAEEVQGRLPMGRTAFPFTVTMPGWIMMSDPIYFYPDIWICPYPEANIQNIRVWFNHGKYREDDTTILLERASVADPTDFITIATVVIPQEEGFSPIVVPEAPGRLLVSGDIVRVSSEDLFVNHTNAAADIFVNIYGVVSGYHGNHSYDYGDV